MSVSSDLAAALAASPQAAQAFDALSKTQQYAVILNLVTARAATARTAQLRSAITALEARDALRAAPAEASPYRRSLSELAAQKPPPILRILRAVVDGEAAVDVQLAG